MAKAAKDARLSDIDKDPLPPEVARLAVTRAYVHSVVAASTSEERLPDYKLSPKDFREFAETFLRTNIALYQERERFGSTTNPAGRMARITAMMKSSVTERRLTWQGLAFQYFSAYYEGKFVDRSGGELSKPKLGMTIGNETIVGAVIVGLESIYDYAAVTTAGVIKNPVLFVKKDGKQEFQTVKNRRPTLLAVLNEFFGKPPDGPVDILEYVIEELRSDNSSPGISRQKLEIVRAASGFAGEAAGGISDFIVRTVGGVDIGFVLLGKFSFGDNDTLAKIVQAIVDATATRATEAAVSTLLYEAKSSATFAPGAPALLGGGSCRSDDLSIYATLNVCEPRDVEIRSERR